MCRHLYRHVVVCATLRCCHPDCLAVCRSHRNEEWEWKYTRAQIYNEYFDWYSAVPPPFNLFYITARIINDIIKKKLVYALPVSAFLLFL
uniref:Mannosyltransferase n=1 Tax=Parascaris equorum TaxID=6256 RepID=A0A914RSF9_PAREQ